MMRPPRIRAAIAVCGAIGLGLAAGSARAQERGTIETERSSALAAASNGELSPLVSSAIVGSPRALALGGAGYDSARHGALFDSAAEVALWGPIAIRMGATYSDDTRRLRPSIGARVQLTHQQSFGVDTSLSGLYKAEGFDEAEGEIETTFAIGRRFERIYLFGNLSYGQDPEGNERDAEVRAALLKSQSRVVWGFEGRGRSAIGAQHGTNSALEPRTDAVAGALAMVALGDFVLFAELGPSAVRMPAADWRLGVASIAGLCAVF